MRAAAAVELARQPADRALVADIGHAEAAGRHAAHRAAMLDQHRSPAEPSGRHGRRDAGSGGAIHA